LFFPFLFFSFARQNGCGPNFDKSLILPYAEVPEGFCPFIFSTGFSAPRSIQVMENGDVLVLESGKGIVTVLYNYNENGIPQNRSILVEQDGLNHAVIVHDNYLYASSKTTVFRWKYSGERSNLGNPQIVIKNIACCHHTSRSLIFDSNGLFYVQSGSGSNVDPNSSHARIVRFSLDSIPQGGIEWSTGDLFADGLRNEVGIRFDSHGRLWGVENGVDQLFREDLGGDIHENNPSEEMNLFLEPGKFYGYPYCWSEYLLEHNESQPRGSQWVHNNFIDDGIHTDEWCRNRSNVRKPAYNFQAHMAPMDIIFWENQNLLPNYNGAFVSFHGSWDRQPPAGYRVDWVKFHDGYPEKDSKFLYYSGPGETGPNWPHRPVGLAFTSNCGFDVCLLVSSDTSGIIIAVGYNNS